MYEQASKNSTEFLAAVAAAVLPANGEAARGGARLVWELLSVDHFDTDQNARAMDSRRAGKRSRRFVGHDAGRGRAVGTSEPPSAHQLRTYPVSPPVWPRCG
jgi:hypothetical protein